MTEECKHRETIDKNNVGTCSICGQVKQYPFEKGGKVVVLKKGHLPVKSKRLCANDPWKRHLYYETNKDGIISDLLSRGRTATKKKWGIPNGATIGTLERRWLTLDQIAIVDQMTHTPAVVGSTIPENGRLPNFPAFSMTWTPEVQLKWLEIYEKLAIKEEVKKE